MGYDPKKDPEFQAGAAELQQHMRNGNPDWGGYSEDQDGSGGGGGKGCLLLAGIIGGAGVLAAYLGHRYGGTI